MRPPAVSRAAFALTSAVVTAGLVLQLALTVRADTGEELFASTPDRVVNFFSFFTVLSNVMVAVTTGLLAVRLERPSAVFRALRLNAVIAIAVTGVVFHLALSDLRELTGWDALADGLLHTASPILAVAGWLLLGPRGVTDRRIALLSVVPPLVWIPYTLVRGQLVDTRFGDPYYPYPFMNVADLGYPVVLVNVTLVAVLFLALAAGAVALDRRLSRGAAPPSRAAAG